MRVNTEEKKKILLLILMSGLVVLGGNKFLFPWIRETASIAHCFTYFGVNGLALFLAGLVLFTAGPMLAVSAYIFFLCKRAVLHRQFPPPGRYFIKPRRFQHGRLAVVRGYAGMVFGGLVMPVVLVYAVYAMTPLIKKAANLEADSAECAMLQEARQRRS